MRELTDEDRIRATPASAAQRGHARDQDDVQSMLQHGLIEPARLRELHAAIVSELYRYPAVDPASLARQLEQALGGR